MRGVDARAMDATTRAAERGERATLRVERTSRENHNRLVGPAAAVDAAQPVTLVVRVTGAMSDNGLHPAKLYLLDSAPQLNDPPDPIVWMEVTGDFNVKPMPGQTLATDDTGVAVLVGSYGGAPVYSLGGPAPANPSVCRSMLVGKGADSAFTGTIPAGVGKCSNVGPETIYFAYDESAGTGYWGGWVSTSFTTRAGDTTATVFLDEYGEPAAILEADGGSGTTITRPMTFVGCDASGRMRFVTFDCLWCDGYMVGPCGENQFELLVKCGVVVCDPPVSLPGQLGFWVDIDDITRGSSSSPVTLAFGYRPTPPAGVTGWPDYGADGVAFWGANLALDFPGEDPIWAVVSDTPGAGGHCLNVEIWSKIEGTTTASRIFWGGIDPGDGFPMNVPFVHPIGEPSSTAGLTTSLASEGATDICGDPLAETVCCNGTGESLESPVPLSMDVPTGDLAGTYPLTWDATDGRWESAEFDGTLFGFAFTAGQWRLSCSAGVWRLDFSSTSGDGSSVVGSYPQLSVICSPFALVMFGGVWAAGEITIGIAA